MSTHLKPHILGAVLLALASPIIAQTKDLVYNPVPNCVVVNTGVGGPFAANEIRTYNIVGNGSLASQGGSSTGCGVPGFSNGIAQVQAVEINVVAVGPAAAGNLVLYPADLPVVRTMVNFTTGVTIADTGTVAVSQTPGVGDITIQASAATHVIVKVVGYYSKPVQTVYVHPVPGDHAASGIALLNAMNGITNASATKRYVIKLEPGTYDLGSSKLVMKPDVDIEGSGQEASVIQGGGFATTDDGVIWGAASAELRHLQVKSTGTSSAQAAIPVYLPSGAATRLTNVTLVGSGGGSNYGLRASDGSPWIEEATIRVQGGEVVYGIVARGGLSRTTVKRTVIEVTSGSFEVHGILLADTEHTAEVRDVQITATSSGTAYGIRLIESGLGSLRLTNSTITSEDIGIDSSMTGPIYIENSQVRATGTSSVYGVRANAATVTVDHSEIAGETGTVQGLNVFVGATRLHGGAVSTFATEVCAGVYDESFTFYAGPACP